MSTGTAGTTRPDATLTRTPGRSLGVIAFVLAVIFAAVPYLSTLFFLAMPMAAENAMGIAMLLLMLHLAGMLAALVLGIIATVTNRGRGWGIAAIILSVLLNQSLLSLIFMAVAGMAPSP